MENVNHVNYFKKKEVIVEEKPIVEEIKEMIIEEEKVEVKEVVKEIVKEKPKKVKKIRFKKKK